MFEGWITKRTKVWPDKANLLYSNTPCNDSTQSTPRTTYMYMYMFSSGIALPIENAQMSEIAKEIKVIPGPKGGSVTKARQQDKGRGALNGAAAHNNSRRAHQASPTWSKDSKEKGCFGTMSKCRNTAMTTECKPHTRHTANQHPITTTTTQPR